MFLHWKHCVRQATQQRTNFHAACLADELQVIVVAVLRLLLLLVDVLDVVRDLVTGSGSGRAEYSLKLLGKPVFQPGALPGVAKEEQRGRGG